MANRFLLILIAVFALGSCDTRTMDEGGIGGTGMVAGTVTRVAELQVNGKQFDTATASIVRNELAQSSLEDAISVGDYVSIASKFSGDENVATVVTYSSPVTGTVQLVDGGNNQLQVLGQTIRIDEIAVFTGFTYLTDLVGGDIVEISGYRSGDVITATAIRRVDNTASVSARVEGVIDTLDATAQRLSINGAVINFASVSTQELNPAQLTIGQAIVASGTLSNGELQANRLSPSASAVSPAAGTSISEQGHLTSAPGANQFGINNKTVRLNESTQISDGSIDATFGELNVPLSDIMSINDRVTVEGTSNGDGSVNASALSIVKQQNLFDVNGPIEDINLSLNRIVVQGLFVDLDETTLLLNLANGDSEAILLSDLQIGQTVKVRGNQITPQRVIALSVSVLN